MPSKKSRPWFVYIIETEKRFLYTGIALDPEKRFADHRKGAGAKFFRSQRPRKIVYRERCGSKGRALRRERQIKRLSAFEKRRLCGR
ncbi:MAG: GIY-YIG nuclease family protein [Pseudomonadota bacterium]